MSGSKSENASFVYHFELADKSIRIGVWQDAMGRIVGVDTGGETQVEPELIALETEQCVHCPLHGTDSPACPLAAVVCPVVARFAHLDSHTPARVVVHSSTRDYHVDTSVQQGLRSLLGLLMGGSSCPHMTFFRPMARYHLPFSDESETLFRAVTNFAMASYLLSRREGRAAPDLILLQDIYQKIKVLNQGVSGRLRLMSDSDATSNAIVLLDLFAKYLGSYLDEGLEAVGALYADFLQGQADNPPEQGRSKP
ncbi:hypothetical protein E4656_09245 [Natronospirillum operosum]|uniref:Uncharacterized protein n=1 Tax=Natronospirillum operosum TaxID=2759953 RepID=A0A4Z0WA53_9GAMM|nr:hypothetical protein [Natronospirillum operosum]TGG93235.1 hypothetical protein E4656_09245 [Natronospirillum operosum]